MVDFIKKIFGKKSKDDRGTQPKKTSLDISLAVCALFLEIANIDGEFDDSEKKKILFVLKNRFHLAEKDILELIEAANSELNSSIDMWQFTNHINQQFSVAEKSQVVKAMWEIVYSDGKLEKHEDYLIHKLATLLRLSHKQLIDAKLRVKNRPGSAKTHANA